MRTKTGTHQSDLAPLRPLPSPTATPESGYMKGCYAWEKDEKFCILLVDNLPSKTEFHLIGLGIMITLFRLSTHRWMKIRGENERSYI